MSIKKFINDRFLIIERIERENEGYKEKYKHVRQMEELNFKLIQLRKDNTSVCV